MKKLFLVLGIVLLFAACDNGDMENDKNPLIGTWECSTENDIETFQFTDTAVISTYKSVNPPIDYTVNGTYQYYDTVIIFRMENGSNSYADYSINGNKLTMTFSLTGNTVIYTKK